MPLTGSLDADGWVRVAGERVVRADEVPLPGRHMLADVLGAAVAASLAGAHGPAVGDAIRGFGGVPHRLETIAVRDGVRWVNDSQATIPVAAIAALEAFDAPIVLIAGGRGKNLDMTDLAREVAARAEYVLLIGEAADEFERLFKAAGAQHIERAASLEDAVARGHAIAQQLGGGTVLMSPAATSFDMFADYAARGAAFKAAVRDLATRRGAERDADKDAGR